MLRVMGSNVGNTALYRCGDVGGKENSSYSILTYTIAGMLMQQEAVRQRCNTQDWATAAW